ncbi:hypothetical protein [Leifsonia sp. NPDC080035]|uniref:Lipoprotein n=1 Tax=Leifsonia sp. NPDC080035 TaxID=3143936 RepID=A0AAU7GDD2_9MICO
MRTTKTKLLTLALIAALTLSGCTASIEPHAKAEAANQQSNRATPSVSQSPQPQSEYDKNVENTWTLYKTVYGKDAPPSEQVAVNAYWAFLKVRATSDTGWEVTLQPTTKLAVDNLWLDDPKPEAYLLKLDPSPTYGGTPQALYTALSQAPLGVPLTQTPTVPLYLVSKSGGYELSNQPEQGGTTVTIAQIKSVRWAQADWQL